ncbi:MAG: MFS transporter [Porticoccaceae bacterium]|nr:MFS transporter [Porticoccaceae bacterium]
MLSQNSELPDAKDQKAPIKRESMLLNLLCNLVLPTLILTKLSGDNYLGIKLAIVVALAFPIIYGIHDFLTRGKLNFFSGLGVASVTLTGGISLLEMDAVYIAIKEASIPGLLGIATLISQKPPQPLIRTLILNDAILDVEKINRALAEKDCQLEFNQLLLNASWILAASFFLSSILNYILAAVILTADPGTVAFNEQLGKMTALSFPVIALPAMAVMMGNLFYLFRGIGKLTGMTLEDIVKQK